MAHRQVAEAPVSPADSISASVAPPSLGEATAVWLRIGCLGFGGPAGQIALMHRTLVEEKRWVDEGRFLHALNFCMLLPGPEAQQLATYCGWLLHGSRGGVIAGTLFILPGLVLMLVLSGLYAVFHQTAWLDSIFFGLKAAVLAIVVDALVRIGRRALRSVGAIVIAAVAFLAIFTLGVPFPLIVLTAAVIGALVAMRSGPAQAAPAEPEARLVEAARPVRVLLVWGGLWGAPVAAAFVFGAGTIYPALGVYFSQMAVVTFGGAYAVLAYVAQTVVTTYGWLDPAQMVDGLALAETTPGPLILVLTFVGFLAAYGAPGPLPPLAAGALGALLTTWVTFVPSFLGSCSAPRMSNACGPTASCPARWPRSRRRSSALS